MIFEDREQAGKLLAVRLDRYKKHDPVVLALPRGGLGVARPIAERLSAPLDVILARKLGPPGNPEFAIGAVSARGAVVLNEEALRTMMLPPGYLEDEIALQRAEALRRERLLRGNRPPVNVRNRAVILVDDGIATGMTVRAAIKDLRALTPALLVLAVPVIGPQAFDDLAPEVDDLVTLTIPERFRGVGEFYRQFDQVSDQEAGDILRTASKGAG